MSFLFVSVVVDGTFFQACLGFRLEDLYRRMDLASAPFDCAM
jgi:hypothetical protein